MAVGDRPVALIDADTLLYKVGFLHDLGDRADYEMVIKKKFDTVVEEMAEALTGERDPSQFELYPVITGTASYRYRAKFDKETIYKENRKHSIKPVFMDEMRVALGAHIISRYSTFLQVCPPSALEADDSISIRAHSLIRHGIPHVVVGIDKDLLQIPGVHYNFNKKTVHERTLEDANRWFFTQLLMGDRADNIPGIKGIGIKTATRLLEDAATVEEMWDIVLNTYIDTYKSEDMVSELLYERGNKLWLMRTPGEIWQPPIP